MKLTLFIILLKLMNSGTVYWLAIIGHLPEIQPRYLESYSY